jgi:hypothetical protein
MTTGLTVILVALMVFVLVSGWSLWSAYANHVERLHRLEIERRRMALVEGEMINRQLGDPAEALATLKELEERVRVAEATIRQNVSDG